MVGSWVVVAFPFVDRNALNGSFQVLAIRQASILCNRCNSFVSPKSMSGARALWPKALFLYNFFRSFFNVTKSILG